MSAKTAAPKKPRNPLKIICFTGLVLGVIISWSMVLLILFWGETSDDAIVSRVPESFTEELSGFDAFDASAKALAGEDPDNIEERLSRLQRQARSVEDWLSVLKRRRELALIDRRYVRAYSEAAREAARTYVRSATLAAVAAEAILLDDSGTPSLETQTLLNDYAPRLTQSRFSLLELGVHVLAGNLREPASADSVPELDKLLSLILSEDNSSLPGQIRNDLLINEFLLRAFKGDIPSASVRLNTLVSSVPETTAMAAEFFYDHNEPRRAAELFLRLAGDKNSARAADAWTLAGETDAARNIWQTLTAGRPSEETLLTGPEVDAALRTEYAAIHAQALYNLASSAGDDAERKLWLEKLFTPRANPGRPQDKTKIYGTIQYTRLDSSRGVAILEEEGMNKTPLFDLELLRYKLNSLPPRRAAAEVWLLLGRHEEEEDLYEWAAWYFDHQRLYDETERLLGEASRKGMGGAWFDVHRSLAFIREGNVSAGEKLLREAMLHEAGKNDWRVPANLGRIQEGRRSISAALDYYEAARSLVKENTSAAKIQLRISRCLDALGRGRESRAALERALELDPDNVFIRREIRLLGDR